MNNKILTFAIGLTLGFAATAHADDGCNIYLSVLPVTQGEEVPAPVQDLLANRLEQVAAANGVAADPAQGQFFIAGKFTHILRDATPGPPTQDVIHSYLTLYIGDLDAQTVYATMSMELRGVGTSEQRAYINALHQLNGKKADIARFFEQGRNKILAYYDTNYRTIMAEADRAAMQHDYGRAFYMLMQVPTCCTGYGEVAGMMDKTFQAYIDRQGKMLLDRAREAWAASPDQRGAREAFGYLADIDPESAAYGDALSLLDEIKKSVKSDRDFELREKYHDAVDLEKRRIDAIRQVGVAYGSGQQPSTTNLMWLK